MSESNPFPPAEPDGPVLACGNCGNPDELWAWYSQPERQTITVWDKDGAVKYDYTGVTDSGDDAGPDESYYCGNCFEHRDTIEELVGREPPPATYKLWVNADRTVLVRHWSNGEVEASTRETSAHTWGPPIYMTQEAT